MDNIYMYPKEDYEVLESPNPYVLKLEETLSSKYTIVNQKPNNWVLNMFAFLPKTNIFFFNWIENLSKKRFGKIQSLLFFIFVYLAKMLGKKIVWVLHNLYSHETGEETWTRAIFKLMIAKSDLIITHSSVGTDFIHDNFPKYSDKVKYLIHPVNEIYPVDSNLKKDITFLIWGTIHPYKGVIEFLEFMSKTAELTKQKIVVSGICPNPELKARLKATLGNNIEYIDEFAGIEKIVALTHRSEYVLFTYNSPSILSSGSLMDSIGMGAKIIGPNKGAFKDLREFGFVYTFEEYQDILNIISKQDPDSGIETEALNKFCLENSWSGYGAKLFNTGSKILV